MDPTAARPYMPGYGISDSDEGLLPFSWAEERLSEALRYWVVTSSPDGAPHVMPVWGVWLDRCLWFSTGGRSRKARNLRADPRCIVHTDGEDPVIVHGTAEIVTDPEALAGADRGLRPQVPERPARPGRESDRPRAAAVGVRADRARVRHQPDALDVLSVSGGRGCQRTSTAALREWVRRGVAT